MPEGLRVIFRPDYVTQTDVDNAIDAALDAVGASDATIAAFAGVDFAADELVYATGVDAFDTTPFTAFARTLLDDATQAEMQATLGIGAGNDVASWRNQSNLSLRAALANNRSTGPAKIVVLGDSQTEFAIMERFINELTLRYPGWESFASEPTLDVGHNVAHFNFGGYNASFILRPWTTTGTQFPSGGNTDGGGPSGYWTSLTGSQYAFDYERCDRVTVYFQQGAGTVDIALGKVIRVGTTSGSPTITSAAAFYPGLNGKTISNPLFAPGTTVTYVNANTLTASANASATAALPAGTDVFFLDSTVATGVDMGAPVSVGTVTLTEGSPIITSAGLFTSAMRGRPIVDASGYIPVGAVIKTITSANAAVMNIPVTADLGAAGFGGAPDTGTTTMLMGKWSWTSDQLSRGRHAIRVTNASGTSIIDGKFFYHGNFESGVQVHVLAHSGYQTEDYLALSNGPASGHVATPSNRVQEHIGRIGAHAVVLQVAINDGDLTSYTNDTDALLTKLRVTVPNATIALIVPEPSPGHTWAAGVPAAARALSETYGCVVADLNTLIYDHSASTAADKYRLTVDDLHYSEAGKKLVSQVLLDTLDGVPNSLNGPYTYETLNGGRVGFVHNPALGDPTRGVAGPAVWTSMDRDYPDIAMVYTGINVGIIASVNAGTAGDAIDHWIVPASDGTWTTLETPFEAPWFYDPLIGRLGSYSDSVNARAGVGHFGTAGDSIPGIAVGYLSPFALRSLFGSITGTTVDGILSLEAANLWDFNNAVIQGVLDPIDATDVVNRRYLNNTEYRPCKYAAVLALTVTYNNTFGTLTNAGAQAAFAPDGTTTTVGDRVLIWNQASSFQNGIYTVTTVGTGATNWVLTRALSFDTAAEMFLGSSVLVTSGNTYGGTRWYVSAVPTTLGTDPIVFSHENLGFGVFVPTVFGGVLPAIGMRDPTGSVDTYLYRGGAAIVGTPGAINAGGAIGSSSSTAGNGYIAGAGGTVTQATDKTTGVTLNKVCGKITMNGAALAASTSVGFTLTNSAIAVSDTVLVNVGGVGTANSYTVTVDAVAAGSCHIHVRNVSAGSLSQALTLNFSVIKAVTA